MGRDVADSNPDPRIRISSLRILDRTQKNDWGMCPRSKASPRRPARQRQLASMISRVTSSTKKLLVPGPVLREAKRML